MKLGPGVRMGGYALIKDPYEKVEGNEKFKKWKRAFNPIGQELQSVVESDLWGRGEGTEGIRPRVTTRGRQSSTIY